MIFRVNPNWHWYKVYPQGTSRRYLCMWSKTYTNRTGPQGKEWLSLGDTANIVNNRTLNFGAHTGFGRIHFLLMYTTHQIFTVVPIKNFVNQDGKPTTPHKL